MRTFTDNEKEPIFFSADGWDGGRNNFVNGYHDNRMPGGNSFNRGPPRMERGRGGVGGGYRGNRGAAFNPLNPAQPMAFAGYEAKGWLESFHLMIFNDYVSGSQTVVQT